MFSRSISNLFGFFSSGSSPVKIIEKNELKEMLKNEEDFFLIDVREKDEIKANGAIENSHNIPIGEIATAFQLNHDDFEEKYGFEKPSQHDTIVFYCKSGGRSSAASELISSMGYRNVMNYSGSYDDWSSN